MHCVDSVSPLKKTTRFSTTNLELQDFRPRYFVTSLSDCPGKSARIKNPEVSIGFYEIPRGFAEYVKDYKMPDFGKLRLWTWQNHGISVVLGLKLGIQGISMLIFNCLAVSVNCPASVF
jgi:hypothetical protein